MRPISPSRTIVGCYILAAIYAASHGDCEVAAHASPKLLSARGYAETLHAHGQDAELARYEWRLYVKLLITCMRSPHDRGIVSKTYSDRPIIANQGLYRSAAKSQELTAQLFEREKAAKVIRSDITVVDIAPTFEQLFSRSEFGDSAKTLSYAGAI